MPKSRLVDSVLSPGVSGRLQELFGGPGPHLPSSVVPLFPEATCSIGGGTQGCLPRSWAPGLPT